MTDFATPPFHPGSAAVASDPSSAAPIKINTLSLNADRIMSGLVERGSSYT